MTFSVTITKKEELDEALDRIMTQFEEFPEGMYEITVDKPKTTPKQKRALHLFFDQVARNLNESGSLFCGDFFKDAFECEWSGDMVKALLWKPLQKALLGKKSTKELSTVEVTKIVDYFYLMLANKGIVAQFPSKEYLISEIIK